MKKEYPLFVYTGRTHAARLIAPEHAPGVLTETRCGVITHISPEPQQGPVLCKRCRNKEKS